LHLHLQAEVKGKAGQNIDLRTHFQTRKSLISSDALDVIWKRQSRSGDVVLSRKGVGGKFTTYVHSFAGFVKFDSSKEYFEDLFEYRLQNRQ
jgi:hypothetical protein